MVNREHAKKLLQTKSEREVQTFINNVCRTYDSSWHPIGEDENNYGVVEAQAISPLSALNEIISNGIDAVLRRKYREKYAKEYQEKHDISSYSEAGERLLDGDEEIRIIADGEKGGPTNITIHDTGEGQSHDVFGDTFVGLMKPGKAKQGWPFLQGQFGMGSTAVLPHCGKNGYKAIFSSGMNEPNEWSWTLIKLNDEGVTYEYLKVDGEIPHFSGSLSGYSTGSFIKMFNYDLPSHNNITQSSSGLRHKLGRTITYAPVPVKLDERRDYQSDVMEIDLVGLKTMIERKSEYVEQRAVREYDFGGEIGQRDVEIVVFKSDDVVESSDELKKRYKQNFVSRRLNRERAIFFTVNGQVHGDLGLSFVKNRCGKYHLGKNVLAFVDFSDFKSARLVDMFTAARDRLQDKPMANRLRDGMEDLITNDPMLTELEQKRQEQFTRDKREEKMGDMLEELVERNPALLEYLDKGERVKSSSAGGDNKPEEYTAPFYPDTLKIIESKSAGEWEFWDSDEQGRYEVEVPVNRNGWVRLHLNAQNDFFHRDDCQGTLIVEPQDAISSWGISNGVLSFQLKPLEGAQAGLTMPVSLQVGAEGMEPLTQQFNLSYVEPKECDTSHTPEDDIPPFEQLDWPAMYGVWRDPPEGGYAWDDSRFDEPFDEDTPVQLVESEDQMELFVNFDAGPVRDFLSRHSLRPTGKEAIRETWKVGVALYAVSTFIEIEDEFADEINPKQITEVSMRGIAQSMLDQHVSDDELEAWEA
jgi:hypothetical protein